jgi:hypothetical protein
MMLRRLQQEFQRDLLGEHSAISAAIVDAPPLPAEARLDIYRTAYRVRLTEALDDVYAVLHKLLGDETFASMAELFIDANPSPHRSIRWYGRELAGFLAERPPFSEQPILAEIARFEWTLSEVFDAPDATALTRAALQSIDPDAWASLTFRFHPSMRRLAFAWNTVAVWQAATDDVDPPVPEAADEPVPWLVWRQNLQNYFRSLDAAENAALDAALEGLDFSHICEALRSYLDEDDVPLRAATLVAAWIDSGIIIGLD